MVPWKLLGLRREGDSERSDRPSRCLQCLPVSTPSSSQASNAPGYAVPDREVSGFDERGERVGATPAIARVAELVLLRARKAKTALLALRDLPPHPPQGGFDPGM